MGLLYARRPSVQENRRLCGLRMGWGVVGAPLVFQPHIRTGRTLTKAAGLSRALPLLYASTDDHGSLERGAAAALWRQSWIDAHTYTAVGHLNEHLQVHAPVDKGNESHPQASCEELARCMHSPRTPSNRIAPIAHCIGRQHACITGLCSISMTTRTRFVFITKPKRYLSTIGR